MPKIAIAFAAIIALTASLGSVQVSRAEDNAADIAEAKKIIMGFATDLKGRLQAAMKEGGPKKAIDVCRIEAPEVAENSSKSSGWRVARTSLKLRNPSNEPDEWELKILNMFEEKRAGGADPAKLAHAEKTTFEGKPAFRFMKAIPTGDMCLLCHGANVAPEIKDALNEHYPDDQAIGFESGDIRGAFTLVKPLE